MNTNFKLQFDKWNGSLYKLSKETGIPYTTINEIYNGKTDINKCSAEIVQRLAVGLSTNFLELLNPIHYTNNVSGKYRNIKYRWEMGDNGYMQISIMDAGNKKVLPTTDKHTLPSIKEDAQLIAEILIDKYIKTEQITSEMEEYV